MPDDPAAAIIDGREQLHAAVFAGGSNDPLLPFLKPCSLKGLVISNHAFIFKQKVTNFAAFNPFLVRGTFPRQTVVV